MKNVIMIDNSPQAYSWQRENGIPIISWFGNTRDNQLSKLIPVLQRLEQVEDVREIIPNIVGSHSVNYYEAFRALKAPRESSPLDDFLNALTRLKREAAAFFSGNPLRESTSEENKDTQGNNVEETKQLDSNTNDKNTSSNIEERHQTDPGCTKEDFIDNDLFSANHRFKPSIVKVAQKTVKINKSESLRLLSTGKLNNEEEKSDVDSELEDNNSSDQDEYSNKQNNEIIDTEQSDPTENIKDEHLESENIKHKLELLEKQDEDTNISGVKNSISSKEHNSKDVQTPPSSIHENGNDQFGTPNKLNESLKPDKMFSTHSPFQEKTENFDIPEAPEPQKLKSSTYIKENILLNHSLKIKTEESLAKVDSTYQNSYHHKIISPNIEWIQTYTPNKLHTMRDNLNFRALDYYNSYSTTRRKMKELKETPNKLILNNLVARPKNLISFDESKGSLTRPRPSYSRYIHQLKGDYMQKGNLILSTNLLSNNKQMFAAKYSADTISSMRPESPI